MYRLNCKNKSCRHWEYTRTQLTVCPKCRGTRIRNDLIKVEDNINSKTCGRCRKRK